MLANVIMPPNAMASTEALSSPSNTVSSPPSSNNTRNKRFRGFIKRLTNNDAANLLYQKRTIFLRGNNEDICGYIDRNPSCCNEKFNFGGGLGNQYPLVIVCRRSCKQLSLKTVQAVYNANPSAIDGTLHHAIGRQAPLPVVQFLVSKQPDGARARSNGWLPLHKACACMASFGVVEYLMDCYPEAIKLRLKDKYGLPLHIAIEHGASFDVIKLLVSKYPNAMKMADYKTREIINVRGWLKYAGTDSEMDLFKGDGGLPLHLACRDRPQSIVLLKYLILQYPNALKSKNRQGWLPLHMACCAGSGLQVIKMIVDCCPEAIMECTIDYSWPMDMCVSRLAPNLNVIQYLLSKHPTVTGKKPNQNLFRHYSDQAAGAFNCYRVSEFLRIVARRAGEGYTFVYPRET